MRISQSEADFLTNSICSIDPDCEIFLFGSRANDELRGGDIDILVLGERVLTMQETALLELAFCGRFGEQKIDIVSFTKGSEAAFKAIALQNAIRL